jgi:hypothetical protein
VKFGAGMVDSAEAEAEESISAIQINTKWQKNLYCLLKLIRDSFKKYAQQIEKSNPDGTLRRSGRLNSSIFQFVGHIF